MRIKPHETCALDVVAIFAIPAMSQMFPIRSMLDTIWSKFWYHNQRIEVLGLQASSSMRTRSVYEGESVPSAAVSFQCGKPQRLNSPDKPLHFFSSRSTWAGVTLGSVRRIKRFVTARWLDEANEVDEESGHGNES